MVDASQEIFNFIVQLCIIVASLCILKFFEIPDQSIGTNCRIFFISFFCQKGVQGAVVFSCDWTHILLSAGLLSINGCS